VQALCSYSIPFCNRERRAAFVVGAFATLIWLALLSFSVKLFWISPLVPWSMIVATVGVSVYFWHRLLGVGWSEETAVAKVAAAGAGA